MKTIKRNVPFLFAVLAALLFAACGMSLEEEAGSSMLSDMGSVQVSFNEETARAVMPNPVSMSDFTGGFQLIFTAAGSTQETNSRTFYIPPKTSGSLEGENFIIPVGEYIISVYAYVGKTTGETPAPANAAATATSSKKVNGAVDKPTAGSITSNKGMNSEGVQTIAGGTDYKLNIQLHAIPAVDTSKLAKGRFAWNITNNITGLTNATMAITPVFGTLYTAESGFSARQLGTVTLPYIAAIDLYPGCYTVVISLTKGDVVRTFEYEFHIYQNMRSEFSYTFTNAHMGM